MPDFAAQNGEPLAAEQRRTWFRAMAQNFHEQGATFFRYSIHPDLPHLALIEGWRERPADQGEPRFFLTYVDGAPDA